MINGSKRYITNSPVADVFMVFARTDPDAKGRRGISVFMVERNTPGFTVSPKDAKMGQRRSWTAGVHLDGVTIAEDTVVRGAEHDGNDYRTAMKCVAHGRVHIAALYIGMMQRLVNESVSHAAGRGQGGNRSRTTSSSRACWLTRRRS